MHTSSILHAYTAIHFCSIGVFGGGVFARWRRSKRDEPDVANDRAVSVTADNPHGTMAHARGAMGACAERGAARAGLFADARGTGAGGGSG